MPLSKNRPLTSVDLDTGEILDFTVSENNRVSIFKDVDDLKHQRFLLLSKIQGILGRDFPVFRCHRFSHGEIKVIWSLGHNKAHFVGLVTCGSPWTCPVCSAKIASKRAVHIKQAIDLHTENNGGLFMVTLTVPHYYGQRLDTILKNFQQALTNLHAHRDFVKFRKEFNVLGHIRALEVTFSHANGWHVHTHQLVFTTDKQSSKAFTLSLLPMWQRESTRVGFRTPSSKGVDVRYADANSGDYVTKWGSHNELSKSAFKQGRGESLTPFDLLNEPVNHVHFLDYARTFSASKGGRDRGVSQLSFSRNLNTYLKALGFNKLNLTDEELVSTQESHGHVLTKLHSTVFTNLQKKGQLAALLASAKGGLESVQHFINSFNEVQYV